MGTEERLLSKFRLLRGLGSLTHSFALRLRLHAQEIKSIKHKPFLQFAGSQSQYLEMMRAQEEGFITIEFSLSPV